MSLIFTFHSFGELVESILALIGSVLLPLLPVVFGILAYFDIISLTFLKVALFFCFVLFVILPIIYKYSYTLQRYAVFLTFVHVPAFPDYKNPSAYGLKGSRNFYINTDDGVKLGVWQILPENITDFEGSDESFEDILDNGQDIIIYSHGNGGTRLSDHRIEMYKVLRKFFHVFAFDYRGYGDSSSSSPSEIGCVNDLLNIYKWIQNRTKSLDRPLGLILEAPFNNMKEEISEFPLAQLFKHLPWFKMTVVNPMAKNFPFTTDKYICGIDIPVMILHAKDDKVVPYKLGYKLYQSAEKCRLDTQGGVIFHSFDEKYHFGHKFICKALDLSDKIRDFTTYVYTFQKNHKTVLNE
ncbi:hypothetical protein GWI33_005342 [Rhynchophorus ferrugineus]|uniref:Uncharacterized protein n=1 Tax=Rhynchophorus ferrugineus TaxID=354439 RepID=A0A834MNY9_RHYFE|nr:hypothetical protein GWI33_005342 [Rhynchophorus ferrugineus]